MSGGGNIIKLAGNNIKPFTRIEFTVLSSVTGVWRYTTTTADKGGVVPENPNSIRLRFNAPVGGVEVLEIYATYITEGSRLVPIDYVANVLITWA